FPDISLIHPGRWKIRLIGFCGGFPDVNSSYDFASCVPRAVAAAAGTAKQIECSGSIVIHSEVSCYMLASVNTACAKIWSTCSLPRPGIGSNRINGQLDSFEGNDNGVDLLWLEIVGVFDVSYQKDVLLLIEVP